MRSFTFLSLLASTTLVSAYPQPVNSELDVNIWSNWTAPHPTDSRGPCPCLNALANHGILPKNGRGLTLPILIKALSEGINVEADFTIPIGSLGISTSPIPGSDSFDLNNLAKHNVIEHDHSLSRMDGYFGNPATFQQDIWNTVLDLQEGNSFNIVNAEKARQMRIYDSKQKNPNFTMTAVAEIISVGETALYLSVLSSPIDMNPPVAFVNSLFVDERLPYDQGWRKSEIPITFESLSVNFGQLQLASGAEIVPNTEFLTAELMKSVFSGATINGHTPCYLPNGTKCT